MQEEGGCEHGGSSGRPFVVQSLTVEVAVHRSCTCVLCYREYLKFKLRGGGMCGVAGGSAVVIRHR